MPFRPKCSDRGASKRGVILEATLYIVKPVMKCSRVVWNQSGPHVVMMLIPVELSAVSAVMKHATMTMRYFRRRGQLNGCWGQLVVMRFLTT